MNLKNIQNFLFNNLKTIITLIGFLILSLIFFQIYNYIKFKNLKETSIKFFNTIDGSENIVEELKTIKEKDGFFSILSSLKIIQSNNNDGNFKISNELYKKLLQNNNLNKLYKSSICVHASYTLIHASYKKNTNIYLSDILYYINNINDDLENFFAIKKELEYLLVVTEIDLNKSEYKNNNKANELFKEIYNSSLISSSVKQRVKKIHEFQLYK